MADIADRAAELTMELERPRHTSAHDNLIVRRYRGRPVAYSFEGTPSERVEAMEALKFDFMKPWASGYFDEETRRVVVIGNDEELTQLVRDTLR